MNIIFQDIIIDEQTVCPYCLNTVGNKLGCCGESSNHFEEAYVDTDNNLYLKSETSLVARLRFGINKYINQRMKNEN